MNKFLFPRLISAVFLLLAVGVMQCAAFCPPLYQGVSASQVGGSVQFQVYDPIRQQTMQGSVSVVANLLFVQDGIVAWSDAAGQVGFAVYDPNVGTWKIGAGAWTGSIRLINSDGVVAWGSGDGTVHCFTYDPSLETWQGHATAIDPLLHMSVWSGGGAVAWLGNGGAVNYTIYDPTRKTWQSASSSGVWNNTVSVSVTAGTVTWTSNGTTYTRGYDCNTGSWSSSWTTPFAYFFASPIATNPPVNLWITDMSVGGYSSAGAYYTYTDPGAYRLSLGVAGPGGYSVTNWTIRLNPSVLWNYITNNGTITITKYNGFDEVVPIPDTFGDLLVTIIGSRSFDNNQSSASVLIPNSVTRIDDFAFAGCSYLTNITIPNSVKSIGNSAFFWCYLLTDITIPDSVTNLGDFVFQHCENLVNFTLGTNITSLPSSAFRNCTSLASVEIPNSIKNIGDFAFADCYKLTNLEIGANVTNIEESAFDGCSRLANLEIGPNVTTIGSSAFHDCSSLTSLVIPNSVIGIETAAFYLCNSLTNIMIGTNVASIGVEAFAHCWSLTQIAIPSSVTSIDYSVFLDCVSLTTILVASNNPAYCSIAGVLFNKNQTTLVECPAGKAGSYVVPDGVTSIGFWAFANTSNLTKVTIPKSVATLHFGAFYSCTSLTGIYFQGNAPSLDDGTYVFYADTNLTVYYLPGTGGWGKTFGGRPTVCWNPQAQTGAASFGVRTNRFGFNITGSKNLVIVVEGSTNLLNWLPVSTNKLNTFVGTNGTSYFSEPQWTNYPGRFYRLRSP